ncbi:iron complex transport system substrate-binding protein [Williamsia limnetica]|jgi:iron complex transport system substrate-binding protein|uniref:Iron complex transport system substrate-binding protein n=1 Tax=Williamsia limnetica TaxID=882452 RepID=A0A318RG56_WILLI|nr:iron-siderophore ABC transporter substrate-binding protein [Williamsia limnetica]PYE12092.1 iron complex transport system substrate-binding protein [Williamsia limnetica]
MLRRAILCLTVLGVLVVAGCSGSSNTDEGSPSGATTGSYPVTVDTKFGPVTIEEPPKRVVALGWGDAETALALGVQPVGASDWLDFGGEGVGPWAAGLYDSPPEIIATREPSFEQILALEPDLILDTKSSGDQKRYDTLKEIAPTVALPAGADNYKTTLEQQVAMVSQALGVPDKGTELIDQLNSRFAEVAAQNPEFAGKTVTVAARSGNGWGAYAPDTERVAFMRKLGFVANPAIDPADAKGFSIPVAEENLQLLDADMLVVFPIGRTAAEVEAEPVFKAVPAVVDGRYLVFDDTTISRAYSTNSVLSVRYALDTVPPLVAERTT